MIEILIETLKAVAILFSIIFILRLMYDFTIGKAIREVNDKKINQNLIDYLEGELVKEINKLNQEREKMKEQIEKKEKQKGVKLSAKSEDVELKTKPKQTKKQTKTKDE